MITSTRGLVDETLLQKREGIFENENEKTHWLEYWDGGDSSCQHFQTDVTELHCACGAEKLHRSVDMYLKKPMVFAEGVAAKLPGPGTN